MKLTLICGDAFEELKKIEDESIDLVITSPPYWKLRFYLGNDENQYGLEKCLEDYLNKSLEWIKETYRILKPSGSFVLNIGDVFFNGKNINGAAYYKKKQFLSVSSFLYCRIITETDFICRGEHIWAKPNVPSNIKDRLKHCHEKIFWFVKKPKNYYFDLNPWLKPLTKTTIKRYKYKVRFRPGGFLTGFRMANEKDFENQKKAQHTIESSWRVIAVGEKQTGFELHTKEKKKLHPAPFPTKLIRPYIVSLCPPNGVVLDPFLGSGTTMRVCLEEKRNCIGIDIVKTYIEYVKKRLNWGECLGVEYEER